MDTSLAKGTPFAPSEATARAYRTALGQFATGVTIVTCDSADGPMGMTANSFSSVSLDPALVLWSPGKASQRHDSFVSARNYAVHVLSADQADLCNAFAKDPHAFDMADWMLNTQNVPLLENCLARFECTQYAVHDAGDHSIILGQVDLVSQNEGTPLIFAQGNIL